MNFPLVSIILATYNRAEWLPKSIGSVFAQTYSAWELIVWDDGSQDETRKVVDSFDDPRVIYSFAENHGQSFALNQALKLAQGDYIAFLDDDDQWYPEKLSIQVNALEKFPQIDLLFSNFNNINLLPLKRGPFFEQNKRVMEKLSTKKLSSNIYQVTSGIPEELLLTNFILPSSTIMKRNCYKTNGDFCEQLRNGMDLEYWWRLSLANAQFAFIDSIILDRIKPPGSLSGNNIVTYMNHIKALDFCMAATVQGERNDLLPYFRAAYILAWQQLIRLCALSGDRKKAIIAYKNSLKYGFNARTFYLLLGALLGLKLINLIRKRSQ